MFRPGIRPHHRQHVPGEMNKSERAYAAEILQPKANAGEIVRARFESMKLRLADDTWLTVDFTVTYEDHIELHEVKAAWMDKKSGKQRPHFEDDALVKLKVAAEQYPEFLFVAVWKTHEGWQRREYK
jgi:hypothetical protein